MQTAFLAGLRRSHPALPQLESEGIVHIDDEEEAAASAEDSARAAQEANDAALARRLVSTA